MNMEALQLLWEFEEATGEGRRERGFLLGQKLQQLRYKRVPRWGKMVFKDSGAVSLSHHW